MPPMIQRLTRFGLAGLLAFAAGALVLEGAVGAGVDPLAAQVPAFIAAMTVSWLANRRLTFAMRRAPSWREYGAYAASSAGGLACNFGGFTLAALMGAPHLIALASGTVLGMGVNFAAYARFVFRPAPAGEDAA